MAGWTAVIAVLVGVVAAPAASQVEIPLRLEAGHLVVSAETADGRALDFTLGTGSATTVLSQTGAVAVGDGPLTLGGLDVPLGEHETVADDRLTIGGTTYTGIVSSNFLNQHEVLIDLPNGRLVLAPIGRRTTWHGVTLSDPVPLRVFHGVVLALDIDLEGRPYTAMLELGAPEVLVNQAVLDETGLDGSGTLHVAGATIEDVPVSLSDHPAIARFSPNGDGFVIVGTPLTWDCAVAISFVHQELRTCVR